MGTITQNLQKLIDAKNDIAEAITDKGGTVNQGDGFEEFVNDIATIPTGGGDIQFLHYIGYITNSSSYYTDSMGVYNPSSCSIVGASTDAYTYNMIPIITTSSNVFICLPIRISIKSSASNASVSYKIPSNYPTKLGYKANTMTLYSYYKSIRPTVTTANCTIGASTINFSLSSASLDNYFGDFILKFDKT